MAAPALSDLKAFLQYRCGVDASHLLLSNDATLTRALDYALAQVGQQTGYDPFVSGSAEDHLVEVTGGMGRFDNGAVGSVAVSLDSTVYEEGTHYRLYPLNSSPKQFLRWLGAVDPPKPLTVNSAWGYADDYPADVWESIVGLAAAYCLVAYATGKSAVVGSSWTDGDVQQTLATGARQVNVEGISSIAPGILAADAMAVFGQYQRVVSWG